MRAALVGAMPDLRGSEPPLIPEGAEEASELLKTTRRSTGILGTIRNIVGAIFVIVAGGLTVDYVVYYINNQHDQAKEFQDRARAFEGNAVEYRVKIQEAARSQRQAAEALIIAMKAGRTAANIQSLYIELENTSQDYLNVLDQFDDFVSSRDAQYFGHPEMNAFRKYGILLRRVAYNYQQCLNDYQKHYSDASDDAAGMQGGSNPDYVMCRNADGFLALNSDDGALDRLRDCETIFARQIAYMTDRVSAEAAEKVAASGNGISGVGDSAVDPYWSGVGNALAERCSAEALKPKLVDLDNPGSIYFHPRRETPPVSTISEALPVTPTPVSTPASQTTSP